MTAPLPEIVLTLQSALRGEPSVPFAEPWLAWLAIALCRQRARQDWLIEVARERLDGLQDSEGRVPGLPEWSFDFHGRGLCLSGPGNEVLDVDFYPEDKGPQTIDPHFFIARVTLLEPKPSVERRLEVWFANERNLLVEGLARLRTLGVISHPTSQHVFHLHPWLEAHYRTVAEVDFDNDDTWCGWVRRVGDQPDEATVEHDGFVRWGLGLLQDRKKARIINALAPRLPQAVAADACRRLLKGPVDFVTGCAVRVLREQGRPPGADAMALMARLDPKQHNPSSACELAEWMLLHGMQEQGMALVHRFAAQREFQGFRGNPFDAEYAVLALRFARAEAMPLVQQSLHSRTPHSVHKIAALLSVLDEHWCRSELLEAAADVKDRPDQRFIVGCLMHSRDEETRTQARRLLLPPPDFTNRRLGYTYEEVTFLNLRRDVEYHREQAREVARLIRPH